VAKAVLVFPDIKKGAFVIGAQWGYGALRKGTKTVGYYRTTAASYGFQAGVKKFGYALFFMTDSALAYLKSDSLRSDVRIPIDYFLKEDRLPSNG
jgi:lipid-binding SYLF domain-containing protein